MRRSHQWADAVAPMPVEIMGDALGSHTERPDSDARRPGEAQVGRFAPELQFAVPWRGIHRPTEHNTEVLAARQRSVSGPRPHGLEVPGQGQPGNVPTNGSSNRYPGAVVSAIVAGSAWVHPWR